jgi:hypothetical protein
VGVAVGPVVPVGVGVAVGGVVVPVGVAVPVSVGVAVAEVEPDRSMRGPTHKARSPVFTPAESTVKINLTSLPASALRSTSTL